MCCCLLVNTKKRELSWCQICGHWWYGMFSLWKSDCRIGIMTVPVFSVRHAFYIDGLVQERRNSIANALELGLSCSALTHRYKSHWVNLGDNIRLNVNKIYLSFADPFSSCLVYVMAFHPIGTKSSQTSRIISLSTQYAWSWNPNAFIVFVVTCKIFPDSKVQGASMGPTWVLSAPGGPHVGHMNLAVWVVTRDEMHRYLSNG